MKELYVSENNILMKTQKWLKEIEYYVRGRKERFKIDPPSSALLVIDMQEFFLNEKSHAFLPSAKTIVPNIKALLNTHKKNNQTVIFTRYSLEHGEDEGIMGRWWGDTVREGSFFSRIVSPLEPKESEIVIRKTRYSAFQKTGLEQVLKDRSIKNIIITGVMTHLCCESTAREAFMKDFEVFFVIDATAAQYEELHLSSLKTLSDGFVIPVTTKEVLRSMESTCCTT